jgi:hypothetical protein
MMVIVNYGELRKCVNKGLFIYFIYLFIYDGPQLIPCNVG